MTERLREKRCLTKCLHQLELEREQEYVRENTIPSFD